MGTEKRPKILEVFSEKGKFGDDEEETDGAGYEVGDAVEEKELVGLLVRGLVGDGKKLTLEVLTVMTSMIQLATTTSRSAMMFITRMTLRMRNPRPACLRFIMIIVLC